MAKAYSPECVERLSGKSQRHKCAASRKAEKLLFRPLWPPYTGRIRCRNSTPQTFQTVSEGKFSEVRPEGVLGSTPPAAAASLVSGPLSCLVPARSGRNLS